MHDVLAAFPGAQRALFRKYHIGGCASCGFSPDETLEQLCARNNGLNVAEVLEHIRASHEQDAKILIEPKDLKALLVSGSPPRLVDIRSREEYEAVKIEGALLLSQPLMQEIMGKWPPEQVLVIVDHAGKQGMDAAAYFLGHGLKNVRCLRGGIDAWAEEVDTTMQRYRLG
jgi:rhodanese-related sulfurtransferase